MSGFNQLINSDMCDTHYFNSNPTVDVERKAKKVEAL